MAHKRTHVFLSEDLLSEIDHLVGQRGRSAFLAEVLGREVQQRKLLMALREAKGSWRREDHPELEQGSERWVEELRQENESRVPPLES